MNPIKSIELPWSKWIVPLAMSVLVELYIQPALTILYSCISDAAAAHMAGTDNQGNHWSTYAVGDYIV